MMIALRDKELEDRINALVRLTGHKKSYYVREALMRYMGDIEDHYRALKRENEPRWDIHTLIKKRDLEG